jgi:hypothetical protein
VNLHLLALPCLAALLCAHRSGNCVQVFQLPPLAVKTANCIHASVSIFPTLPSFPDRKVERDNACRGWKLWNVWASIQPQLSLHMAKFTHQRDGRGAGCRCSGPGLPPVPAPDASLDVCAEDRVREAGKPGKGMNWVRMRGEKGNSTG